MPARALVTMLGRVTASRGLAKAGNDLYALNPDYRDPGAGRPSYDGRQPVRNGDLADLTTRRMGLPPVPNSVFGAPDQLDVR